MMTKGMTQSVENMMLKNGKFRAMGKAILLHYIRG